MTEKPTIDAPSQEGDAPVSQVAKVKPRALPPAKPDDDTNSFALAQSQEADAQQHHQKKHHRTLGLRLFDGGTYFLLVNSAVMALSIASTYLTTHSKGNNIFKRRGDDLKNFLETRVGLDKRGAHMYGMVFWSFFDGTLVAPFVKILEDNRIKIAHWIDRTLGTEPKDQSVYAEEPKQSWLSVIGGRLSTLAVVLPTAIALNNFPKGEKEEIIKGEKIKVPKSINYVLFEKQGRKLGEEIEKRPNIARHFGKLNIPGLMSIAIFEAVYTTICTTGLYFVSRGFANKIEHRKEKKEAKLQHTISSSDSPAVPKAADDTATQPSVKITDPQNIERLSNPLSLGQASA